MANINRYLFQNVVTANAVNATIYKPDDLYVLAEIVNNDNVCWIDINKSQDNGYTWTVDEDLPIFDYALHDPKGIIVDNTFYIFAHGITYKGIDGIYFNRRVTENGESTWGDWTLLTDYYFNHRLTDVCTDSTGSAIHFVYEQLNTNDKFEVHYGMLSTSDYTVKHDIVINPVPYRNQSNAKLLYLSGNVVAISWEEENHNGIKQVFYAQYDFINKELSEILQLSDDEYNNNYHHSLTKDADGTVHIAWLKTPTTISTPKSGNDTFFYEKNHVLYTKIIGMEKKAVETISTDLISNDYPYIFSDENEDLYVVFSKSPDTLQYLSKKLGSDTWIELANITKNNLKILSAYCVDHNLYVLIRQDNIVNLLRVDTNMAEEIKPVSDLQIASLEKTKIRFAWSPVRNAEQILLQQLAEDNYHNVPESSMNIQVVGTLYKCQVLMPQGRFKFRVVYTIDDKSNFIYFDDEYINDNIQNIYLEWNLSSDVTSYSLQYSAETWNTIAEPSYDSYYYEADFDGRVTRFRLQVIGGQSEGFSNEVQPLDIALDNDKNVLLSWLLVNNATSLKIQQTIDGWNWYDAKTVEPVSLTSTSATIPHINDILYQFRLQYEVNGSTQTSNIVSMVNNFKVIDYTWHSVSLQWNDIDSNEQIKFQYSSDNGLTWETTSVPISNNVAMLTQLSHDTIYLLRMYYPNRCTGVYSNVVSVHTQKKPITTLSVSNVEITSASFSFYIDESYEDIEMHIKNTVEDTEQVILLSTLELDIDEPKPNVRTISFMYDDFRKGTYYDVFLTPLGSHYGLESNHVIFNTVGDAIPKITNIDSDAHSVTLTWNALDRIDADNIKDFVSISYSIDGVNWVSKNVDIFGDTYTVSDLMQSMIYKFRIICTYGDNYGVSDIVGIKTKEDSFLPVYGNRLPSECSFVVMPDDNIIVFDRGKLYSINGDEQVLLWDYEVEADNVYSSMICDKNGYVHLIYAYGKKLYYVNNLTGEYTNTLIYNNELVNAYLNPFLALKNDNTIALVFEEDWGHYSIIASTWFQNGSVLKPYEVLLNDGIYHHHPIIKLSDSGDWYLFTLNEAYMTMTAHHVNNDYTSDEYLSESTDDTVMFGIINPPTNRWFANYDVAMDNLGGLRIFYDSYNEQDVVEYNTYIGDEYKAQICTLKDLRNACVDINNFVVAGLRGSQVYACRYISEDNIFTDLLNTNITVEEDANPLNVYYTSDTMYVLSFYAGKFLVQTKPLTEIVQQKYVNGKWIDNVNTLQVDEDDYIASIWTYGDIHDYPKLFININNIVKEITPKNESGDSIEQDIIVDSFENLDLTDEETIARVTILDNTKSMCEIKYNNNKSIVIDVTNYLYYTFDRDNVANPA